MTKPIPSSQTPDFYGWNSAEDIAQDCEKEARFHRTIRNIAGIVTIIALTALIIVGLTFNAITLGWGSLLMTGAFIIGGVGLSTTISSMRTAATWEAHAEKCRQTRDPILPGKPANLSKALS